MKPAPHSRPRKDDVRRRAAENRKAEIAQAMDALTAATEALDTMIALKPGDDARPAIEAGLSAARRGHSVLEGNRR